MRVHELQKQRSTQRGVKMAKNEIEAEFLRKRELIIEKISNLKTQNISITDFYKCTNDIIFEEDEAD